MKWIQKEPNIQQITPKTPEGQAILDALHRRMPIVEADYSEVERRCLAHDKPEEFTK